MDEDHQFVQALDSPLAAAALLPSPTGLPEVAMSLAPRGEEADARELSAPAGNRFDVRSATFAS